MHKTTSATYEQVNLWHGEFTHSYVVDTVTCVEDTLSV